MSARQMNNVTFLAASNITTNVAVTAGTMNDITEGEVALFQPDGTRIDNTNDALGMDFVVAVGGDSSKPAFVSDVIDGSTITSIVGLNAEAATEQLDYIGWNGTSGDIEEINDNLYMATVHIQEYLTSNTDGRYIKHFQYKSHATAADKHAVAKGLVLSAINNFSREAENYMNIALVSAEAGDAITGAPTNFTFTEGSKVVTWTGTDPTNVAVGEFLRVGTSPADPIYEVATVDAANDLLTLVHKYGGTTATILVANVEVVELADFDAAAVGVRLEGKPLSWKLGKEFYKKVRWDLQIGAGDGMGTTEVTEATSAYEGSGQYEQVAELEWFCAGNQGEYFRMGEPAIHNFESILAAASSDYSLITINYADSQVVGIGATPTSKKQLVIAVVDDAGGSAADPADFVVDGTDCVQALLNTIAGSSLAL